MALSEACTSAATPPSTSAVGRTSSGILALGCGLIVLEKGKGKALPLRRPPVFWHQSTTHARLAAVRVHMSVASSFGDDKRGGVSAVLLLWCLCLPSWPHFELQTDLNSTSRHRFRQQGQRPTCFGRKRIAAGLFSSATAATMVRRLATAAATMLVLLQLGAPASGNQGGGWGQQYPPPGGPPPPPPRGGAPPPPHHHQQQQQQQQQQRQQPQGRGGYPEVHMYVHAVDRSIDRGIGAHSDGD